MKLLTVLLAALLLSGCVYTNYEMTDVLGRKHSLKRISLGGNQSVAEVDFTKGTLKGYQSDQAQIAGAAVEGAVRAALASRQPQ